MAKNIKNCCIFFRMRIYSNHNHWKRYRKRIQKGKSILLSFKEDVL